MRQIKLTLLWSLMCFCYYEAYSQNIIYNGSFEDGNYEVAQGADNYSGTIEGLYNWTMSVDGYDQPAGTVTWGEHQPDWKYVSVIHPNITPFGADKNKDINQNGDALYFNPPTGDGMLGMGSAQLVQQGFNLPLIKDYLEHASDPKFKLRFKIRIPDTEEAIISPDTKLSFYISKNKLRYRSMESSCTEKYQEIDNLQTHYFSIFDETNLQYKYPSGEWHTIETIITLPSDMDGYEWLGINLKNFDPPSTSDDPTIYHECYQNEYLYIDDVELIFDCGKTCSKTVGVVYPQLFGNLIANSDQNIVRITNLSNVTSLTFEVKDLNGDLVYTNSTYCPNGINHDLFWTGKNANGVDLAPAMYRYKITAGNDCYSKSFEGTINKQTHYLGSITPNFSQVCETGSNVAPPECCEIDMFKDNETLIGPGATDYIIQRNIWVCTKTPDFSDEVRIKSGADILFQAGNQITLREGFNAEPGAVFVAQIDPLYCGKSNYSGKTDPPNPGDNKNKRVFNSVSNIESPIEIYPNPGKGLFTIQGIDKGKIIVHDVLGAFVLEQKIFENKTTVDLINQENGIYFIEIMNENFTKTFKIIKQ